MINKQNIWIPLISSPNPRIGVFCNWTLGLKFLFLLITLFVFSCADDAMDSIDPIDAPINTEREFPCIKITLNNSSATIIREKYVDAYIEIDGAGNFNDFSKDVEIRGRGNSTWNNAKKPYQIKFVDKESVLGMPADRRWILLANYSDKSMLRNEVALKMGQISDLEFTPSSQFVDLYLNNNYRGTYQVTQKVEESSNRVDIGDDGFLLEVDQLSRLDEDDVYIQSDNFLYNVKEPDLSWNDDKFNFIQDHMRKVDQLVMSDDFLHPNLGYKKYFDVDALVDWYLINEITRNTDSDYFTSVYMHLIPGEKIKMGPIWDYDLSLGNVDYNDNHKIDGFYMKNGLWMARFFQDPEFVAQVKERFLYFYSNKEDLKNLIRTSADYLNESQDANYLRWPTLGEYVWPNYVYYDTYEEEVDHLEKWLDDRFEWLHSAFEVL